ncbi:hypothetical protein ACFWPP_04815 [Streptomyces anulatus]|uniref:hypothetical protein n=1 Tax=Streptomyces anulatus TaxID=1892 RepID=UPI00364B429C
MLTAQGSVIAAQRLIENVISVGQADFGLYQDKPQPSLALFGDLRALACILLRRAPERLVDFVPPEILPAHQRPVPEALRAFDPAAETLPGRLAPAGCDRCPRRQRGPAHPRARRCSHSRSRPSPPDQRRR